MNYILFEVMMKQLTDKLRWQRMIARKYMIKH